MTLRRRVQLLFVPFVLLVIFDFGLDRYVVDRRDDARQVIDGRLTPARLALSELLSALVDQETGQRGYIITGQDRFLEPYRSGGARADELVAVLERLFAGDADLRAAVSRMRSRITAWRQLGAEFEIEEKRAGRDAQADALVATGTGMELFDRARTELADLHAAVREALVEEEDRLDDLQSRLTSVREGSLVVVLVFVVVSGVLLVRWIAAPLGRLVASVRTVAAGDLDHPISGTGPADLAALGRDIDGMRERMLAEIDDATRAREALARRGMVVLTLRDELAPAPLDLPPGLAMASRFQPAEGVVAGDWFDAVRLPDDRLVVALVDVAGHGADSAVFALKTKELAMAAIRSGLGPAESLRWLARQLGPTDEQFLTGVILEVDRTGGRLRYASAGHCPVLVAGDGGVCALSATGPLLGPLPGQWEEERADIAPGSLIVVYSDGLVEGRDGGGELGVDGLTGLVARHTHGDLEQLADACVEEVDRRNAGQRRDDMTLVLVATVPAHEG